MYGESKTTKSMASPSLMAREMSMSSLGGLTPLHVVHSSTNIAMLRENSLRDRSVRDREESLLDGDADLRNNASTASAGGVGGGVGGGGGGGGVRSSMARASYNIDGVVENMPKM
jgi:hypothetical protein